MHVNSIVLLYKKKCGGYYIVNTAKHWVAETEQQSSSKDHAFLENVNLVPRPFTKSLIYQLRQRQFVSQENTLFTPLDMKKFTKKEQNGDPESSRSRV